MPTYKVFKNIEKEPIIYGVKTKYFYRLIALLALGTLGLIGCLFQMLSNFWSGLFMTLIFLSVFGFLFFTVWNFFRKKSTQEKYKFSKKKMTLSNKDLLHNL